MIIIQLTLQTSFNDAIYHNEDILRRIFSILKNPHQSLVCQFWHKVNSSWETYRLILKMYSQQEFMTRFTIQLPLQSGEEYICRVKQIFVCVQALVKAAGIECDVKQTRVNEQLGILELNPVMKMLEEAALIALFKKLGETIPEVGDVLNNHNSSLKAETIRAWMQDNSEKLLAVTQLNLINLGLAILPPEIGKLINLQKLSLSSNQLTELPPEIGKLINLQELSFYYNQLTELPPEIGQLINLQELCLTGNQLTELPPEIGRLFNLQWLYLYGNQLTELPPEIGQLINLQWLDLYGNQLTELPPEIGQLINLKELYLGSNQLEQLPESINQLINLDFLNFEDNKLTTLPSCLQTLFENGQLKCEGNPVCDDLPKANWFSDIVLTRLCTIS